MHPPVFEVLSADPVVRNLLLSNSSTIVKIFAAREVPQDTQAPYVAWGLSGGSPENYLGDDADMDQYSTQLDVFAPTLAACRKIVKAISDAIKGKAYITAWIGEDVEPETQLPVSSFIIDWFVDR